MDEGARILNAYGSLMFVVLAGYLGNNAEGFRSESWSELAWPMRARVLPEAI